MSGHANEMKMAGPENPLSSLVSDVKFKGHNESSSSSDLYAEPSVTPFSNAFHNVPRATEGRNTRMLPGMGARDQLSRKNPDSGPPHCSKGTGSSKNRKLSVSILTDRGL